MTDLRAMVRSVPAARLVTELTPQGIRMREKGRRTWFGPIGWSQLYLEIVRREIDAKRRAKTKRGR